MTARRRAAGEATVGAVVAFPVRGEARGRAAARPLPAVAYVFLSVVTVLVGFGMVMVYSSSFVEGLYRAGSVDRYALRQLTCLALGVAGGVGAYAFAKRFGLYRVARALFAASVLALPLVFVPGVGIRAFGACRSILVGGIAFQPSEFVKLTVILFVARELSSLEREGRADDLREVARRVAPVLVPLGLIFLQPDLTTMTLVLVGACFVIYYSSVRLRAILAGAAAGAGVLGALALVEGYRSARIVSFLRSFSDPLAGSYQVKQAVFALARGGWTGVGLGRSAEKYLYLPAAHTDFISAVIGEELGFAGLLALLVLFAILVWSGTALAFKARGTFNQRVILAAVGLIAVQAIVNLGSATSLLPVVGVPLPFVSYGGTSLIACLTTVGAIVGLSVREEHHEASVHRRRDRRPRVSGGQRHPGVADDLELL